MIVAIERNLSEFSLSGNSFLKLNDYHVPYTCPLITEKINRIVGRKEPYTIELSLRYTRSDEFLLRSPMLFSITLSGNDINIYCRFVVSISLRRRIVTTNHLVYGGLLERVDVNVVPAAHTVWRRSSPLLYALTKLIERFASAGVAMGDC